jgi:hypothetical protein
MIGLRFQHVTPMVSHQLTTPNDLGVTHGHSGQTDARKPRPHRRFSRRSHLLPSDGRWPGVSRMCPCLSPVAWLSAETSGDLRRRRMLDTALALSVSVWVGSPSGVSNRDQSRASGFSSARTATRAHHPGRILLGKVWTAGVNASRRWHAGGTLAHTADHA